MKILTQNKNEPVVVVQFSASWCSPGKQLRPIMEKLSVEYKDRMKTFYGDIETMQLILDHNVVFEAFHFNYFQKGGRDGQTS